MDVIINNPATTALPQVQYAPITQTPQGYGPGYGQGQGRDFHGGPGFLLPLLLVGGFLFLRGRGKRRRQMMRRAQMQSGQMQGSQPMPGNPMTGAGPAPAGPFASDMPGSFGDSGNFMDDIRENFRRGRQQFVTNGALDIARERYARGEINAEEYQTILKTLSGQAGGNQSGTTQPPPTIV
jgi:Short C-terminal domain